MRWLARLLKVARRTPLDMVGLVIDQIVRLAEGDRAKYREMMVEAAQSGDLDAPLDAFVDANRRAEDYIKEG